MPRAPSVRDAPSESNRRSSSRRLSSLPGGSDDHPSPGKRQKVKHMDHGRPQQRPGQDCPPHARTMATTPPPRTAAIEEMYSFKTTTIDLTSSPARKSAIGSPLRPRSASIGIKAVESPQSGQGGAKKLVVKNLRQSTKHDPDKYLNLVWEQVDAALSIIFAENTTPFSIEELYRGVENVCRQKKAAEVSRRLVKRCRDHVENSIRPTLLGSNNVDDVEMLRCTVKAWGTWRKHMVSYSAEKTRTVANTLARSLSSPYSSFSTAPISFTLSPSLQ